MKKWILEEFEEKEQIVRECKKEEYLDLIEQAGMLISQALQKGNKVLLAGNGGSAADAQHFAGEMMGRFKKEREAMPAISLCADPSVVTCIGNDYGYEQVFVRQVQGLGQNGDVFVGITTSGNSENIVSAMKEAKKKEMPVIGFLGKDGGKAKEFCDIAFVIPTENVPRIQEMHTFLIHILSEIIEADV